MILKNQIKNKNKLLQRHLHLFGIETDNINNNDVRGHANWLPHGKQIYAPAETAHVIFNYIYIAALDPSVKKPIV